jgi:hypothetical protein
MDASTTSPQPLCETVGPQRPDPESPKLFFRLLRADLAYFHRVFAKWVGQSGFEIRWIVKRANHDLWNLHLLRGAVRPGCEEATARQIINSTLQRCGGGCRKKDIEISVIGNRIGAAFIFSKGHAGSLAFSRQRELWCADEWP